MQKYRLSVLGRAAPTNPPVSNAPTRGRKGIPRCVFVVDDDPTARTRIQLLLMEAGYLVEMAGSYQEWETIWPRIPLPDLIVLDILLPGRQGGYDILRSLRKQQVTLPVVIISARNTGADRALAQASGASAFVSKVDGEFDHPDKGLLAHVRHLLAA